MSEQAGSISALWRYPVKSLAGEKLLKARIGPHGILGDRGWCLLADGLGCVGPFASGKLEPKLMLASATFEAEPEDDVLPAARLTLPDGSRISTSDADAEARLSAWLGKPVALRQTLLGEHLDDKPIHLVSTSSLSALRSLCPGSLFDARRFRPNILVATERSGFPEQDWVGRTLRLGGALLLVEKPTKRCVMTTVPQGDLPKDPEIMKTIIRLAAQVVGVYASVLEPGPVSVSDPLTLL